jgi:hypothetical protein
MVERLNQELKNYFYKLSYLVEKKLADPFKNNHETIRSFDHSDYDKTKYKDIILPKFSNKKDLKNTITLDIILKDGNLEIVLRFTNDDLIKTRPITMLVYLEFDNVLEITKNRNVICNYQ